MSVNTFNLADFCIPADFTAVKDELHRNLEKRICLFRNSKADQLRQVCELEERTNTEYTDIEEFLNKTAANQNTTLGLSKHQCANLGTVYELLISGEGRTTVIATLHGNSTRENGENGYELLVTIGGKDYQLTYFKDADHPIEKGTILSAKYQFLSNIKIFDEEKPRGALEGFEKWNGGYAQELHQEGKLRYRGQFGDAPNKRSDELRKAFCNSFLHPDSANRKKFELQMTLYDKQGNIPIHGVTQINGETLAPFPFYIDE